MVRMAPDYVHCQKISISSVEHLGLLSRSLRGHVVALRGGECLSCSL